MIVHNNWQNEPMTEGQKMYIDVIQSYLPLTGLSEFQGTTKGEACNYISKYKAINREMSEAARLAGETQAITHEDAGDRI